MQLGRIEFGNRYGVLPPMWKTEPVFPPPSNERFFLSRDNDFHWYIIPVARQQEWDEWREISEDDERSWTPPDFAKPVGGAPSLVTFCMPEISA